MEEQQVHEELLVAHGQAVLTPDEGETGAELGQEVGEPMAKRVLQVSFAVSGVESEEVQVVRILQDLPDLIGLGRRQDVGEVVRCGPDPSDDGSCRCGGSAPSGTSRTEHPGLRTTLGPPGRRVGPATP